MKRRGTAAAIDAQPRAQVGLFGPEHLPKASASQWYTPADLAQRIAAWSGFGQGDRLLEPAAGRGALIAPLPLPLWTAVELDEENCGALVPLFERLWPERRVDVRRADFLSLSPRHFAEEHDRGGYTFDGVIMNPPYEDDLDAAFVEHALAFAPVVIALLRSAFRHGAKRWRRVWRWVDCTRIAELVDRPSFGAGLDGDSPMSDFAVYELRRAPHERRRGEARPTAIEWW